jgi:hypothetical protein
MIPDVSMSNAAGPRSSAVPRVIRAVLVFDTVALLFAAALHVAGARIPLGSAEFVEPQIVPAAIVEGLAGLIFAVAAYAAFAGARWAWPMALFAHAFAILGFLVGIFATRNGTSPFNRVYHLVMLVIFVAGVALLLTSSAKAALGRGPQELRSA